ncbi:MAG: type II secretion system protein [Rhizobacter sp.]
MYEPRANMKGFTLIELTVALGVMAMLAAMLLPRVAQLQRSARAGKLQGVRGSVVARVMLVHTAATLRNGQRDMLACAGGGIADNQLTGPGTVCTDKGLVHTLDGYPASTPLGTPGIVSAAGVSAVFNPGESQLKADGYLVHVSAGVTNFARADAIDPAQCSFTYTQALDAQTAAAISVPAVSGC